MFTGKLVIVAAFIAVALASGCASNKDGSQPAAGLASSQVMTQDRERTGAWIYRNPNASAAQYRRFNIQAAEIYKGSEAEFGSADPQTRQRYAAIVTEEFRNVVGEKYPVVDSRASDVATIKLTLLAVEPTTGGLATATRIVPVGAVYNIISSAGGGSGTLTGALRIAVELFDSMTGELLVGAIRWQAPRAFDIESTLSTENTVRAAAHSVAMQLVEGIRRQQGGR